MLIQRYFRLSIQNNIQRFYSQHSKKNLDPLLEDIPIDRIRNFSIIAHIDHGKSTLADRLLELTGTIQPSHRNQQVLDKLKVEKERGITVKAQSASAFYEYKGKTYLLNMVDTPGHVDFQYEVSRSLSACQGILLLVDASQGIQAQTLANYYLAFAQDLYILPILNKIDLPHADPEKVLNELETTLEIDRENVLMVSAKSGLNVDQVLPAIIERIPPPPSSDPKVTLKALLFDSWYDEYKGVVCLLNIKEGQIKKGDFITSHHNKKTYEVQEVGLMHPEKVPTKVLKAGQVGYILTNMKSSKEAHVGDTFHLQNRLVVPLPGFKPMKPMVFSGVFPVNGSEFEKLEEAIYKLTLNDASVQIQKTNSHALGLGFRLGFLGMLHLDVFRQRLQDEFDAQVILTQPNVSCQIVYQDDSIVEIDNPLNFPTSIDRSIKEFRELFINSSLVFPEQYLGPIMQLCERRRGIQGDLNYLSDDRLLLKYQLPLSEVAENHFFNELKSISSGFASFNYEDSHYQTSDLVRIDLTLNSEPVDALSCIVHKDTAQKKAKEMAEKLKKVLNRQQFEIRIQALVNGRSIARETLQALRKDVTAKCYGGDQTRKRKLLDKQKEGKKRMKSIGKVELSHEAFLELVSNR